MSAVSGRGIDSKWFKHVEGNIDMRLAEHGVWDLCTDEAFAEDWSTEMVVALLRAAYGAGYHDAYSETSNNRGDLFKRRRKGGA